MTSSSIEQYEDEISQYLQSLTEDGVLGPTAAGLSYSNQAHRENKQRAHQVPLHERMSGDHPIPQQGATTRIAIETLEEKIHGNADDSDDADIADDDADDTDDTDDDADNADAPSKSAPAEGAAAGTSTPAVTTGGSTRMGGDAHRHADDNSHQES